jgi:hypothetical protein
LNPQTSRKPIVVSVVQEAVVNVLASIEVGASQCGSLIRASMLPQEATSVGVAESISSEMTTLERRRMLRIPEVARRLGCSAPTRRGYAHTKS